jgi:hypothetical protein
MGCDRIAAMNPCKQTHPLQLSAYINWTAVLFLIGEVTMKLAQAECGDNFWLTLASKLEGKMAAIIKNCVIKSACVPNTTDLVLTAETHVNEINVVIHWRWPHHDYYFFLSSR